MLTGVDPGVARRRPAPGYRSRRWAARPRRRPARRRASSTTTPTSPSTMAEHGLDGGRPVIGVAFDGTGYGDDGAVWGGEFLVADYAALRAARAPRLRRPARRRRRRPQPVPDGARPTCARAGVAWDDRLPVRRAPAATTSSRCSTASSTRGFGCVPDLQHGPALRRGRLARRASATAPGTTPRPRWSSRRWPRRGRTRRATRSRSTRRPTAAGGSTPAPVLARGRRRTSARGSRPPAWSPRASTRAVADLVVERAPAARARRPG